MTVWQHVHALILFVGLSFGSTAQASQAEAPRLALVIGIGAYENLGDLPNPENDARLMTRTLEQVGFQVTTVIDADRATFARALSQFEADIQAAGEQTVALIYFAGHGLEIGGENYLLPTDATNASVREAQIQSIALSHVARTIEYAGARVNFLIIDACRENPTRGWRSASSGGLAPFADPPNGTLIAYATAPGALAADGMGDNSPYAQALAQVLTAPNVPAEMAFKRAGDFVLAATLDQQVPWYNSSLRGEDFYFIEAPTGTVVLPHEDDLGLQADRAMWDAIADSGLISDFERYQQRFPDGLFYSIAQERIDALRRAELEAAQSNLENPYGNDDPIGVHMEPASSSRSFNGSSAGTAPSWAWIVTEVDPASPFAGQLHVGDAVITIDHRRLSDIDNAMVFMRDTYETRGRVDLLVRRGGASYALAIQ